MKKHPHQPLVDVNGITRFKENKIVSYILEHGSIDMNHIALRDFPREDRVQFAQLIGYSQSGWGTLSYVKDDDWSMVNALNNNDTEDPRDAKIAALESCIRDMRREMLKVQTITQGWDVEDYDDVLDGRA